MVSGVDLMFLFKDGLSLIIRIIVSLSTLTIFPVFLKKNFMAPFYGWGSTISRLQSYYEVSLLFTTQSRGVPGTHIIDLGKIKG